jgi:hypothetical protein
MCKVRKVSKFIISFFVGRMPNLWLSQPQDCFVVGTVRAQRLSHFRCLATASNGAG